MKRILKFNDIYTLQKDYVDHYQTRLSVVNINNLNNHAIFTIDPDAITVFFRGKDLKLLAYWDDLINDSDFYLNDSQYLRAMRIHCLKRSPEIITDRITVDNLLLDPENVDEYGNLFYYCSDDDTVHCLLFKGHDTVDEEDETLIYNTLVNLGILSGSAIRPKGLFILQMLPPRSIVILPKHLDSIPRGTNRNNSNIYFPLIESNYASLKEQINNMNNGDFSLLDLIDDYGEELGNYYWNALLFCNTELNEETYDSLRPKVYITSDELPTLPTSYSLTNCNIFFINTNLYFEIVSEQYWKDLYFEEKAKIILKEKSIIATYDIDSTTDPTVIIHPDSKLYANGTYEIYTEDFTIISSDSNHGLGHSQHTFSSLGEHIIYIYPDYTSEYDPEIPYLLFSYSNSKGPTRIRLVIVPEGVKDIYPQGLENSYLTSLIFKSTTPPTLYPGSIVVNCPIYVPDSAVDTYKTASTYWTNLADKIKPISELT